MTLLIIARDEVARLLSTRRGMFALVGFVLLWVAVLTYAILPAASVFESSAESGLLSLVLPMLGLSALQEWPNPALAVYWACCLYLLPFFVVLTAADQTASDLSRGTLRYLALRCNRLDIYLGRFAGQCVLFALLILLTLATVLAIIALQNPEHLALSLQKSPFVVVNLLLVLLPYIALMALVSVLARSARQAVLYAMVIWICVSLLLRYLRSYWPSPSVLDWVLPGSQIRPLLVLSDWQALELAPIPLMHTLVLLAAGAVIMHRREL